MITILQGATKKLTVHLESDQGEYLDVTECYNVRLYLYHEGEHEVLAKYSILDLSSQGYQQVSVRDTYYIDFYVDKLSTEEFPPGRMVGEFVIEYVNANFPSGYQVIKGRGVIFNVIM